MEDFCGNIRNRIRGTSAGHNRSNMSYIEVYAKNMFIEEMEILLRLNSVKEIN